LRKPVGFSVFQKCRIRELPSLQAKLKRRSQYANSIHNAAFEVDGRCVFKILGGAGDFADAESEKHRLHDDLIVEDKVVGTTQ
jgi:hypothetical protein